MIGTNGLILTMLTPKSLKNKAIGKVDEYMPFGLELGDFTTLLKRDDGDYDEYDESDYEQAPLAAVDPYFQLKFKQQPETTSDSTGDNDSSTLFIDNEMVDTEKLDSGLNLLHLALSNELLYQNPKDQRRLIALSLVHILESVQDPTTLRSVVNSLDQESKFIILRNLLLDTELARSYKQEEDKPASPLQFILGGKHPEEEPKPEPKPAPIMKLAQRQENADKKPHNLYYHLTTFVRVSIIISYLVFKYYIEPIGGYLWAKFMKASHLNIVEYIVKTFLSVVLWYLGLVLKFVKLFLPKEHKHRHRKLRTPYNRKQVLLRRLMNRG